MSSFSINVSKKQTNMTQTFKQFFSEHGLTDIHDIFESIEVQISNGFSTNRCAVKFFINNFDTIKNAQLSEKDKDLLFIILNTDFRLNGNVTFDRFANIDCFNSNLYYQCFQMKETLLLDVMNYFNYQINDMIESKYFYRNFSYATEHSILDFFRQKNISRMIVESEYQSFSNATIIHETREYLLNVAGCEKLEALLYTNLFYGQEKESLLVWVHSFQEREKLDRVIKNKVEKHIGSYKNKL